MTDQEIKDRIMTQGGELFKRYGIRSVTMDDLASHLSISKKTIYQFFKDKKEVVSASVRYMLDKELNELYEITENSKDVVEELVLLSEYFKKMTRQMNPTLLFDMKKYHPEAWNLYLNRKETCYRSRLEAVLLRGKEQGVIRDGIHPYIISRMRMEVVEMGFNPDIFPSEEYDISEVQMNLFDHFVHGIVTPKGLELMDQCLKEKGLH